MEPPVQAFDEHLSLDAAAAMAAPGDDLNEVREEIIGDSTAAEELDALPSDVVEEVSAEAEPPVLVPDDPAEMDPASVEWTPASWGPDPSGDGAEGDSPPRTLEAMEVEPEPNATISPGGPETGVADQEEVGEPETVEPTPVSVELESEPTPAADDGDRVTIHDDEVDRATVLVESEPDATTPEPVDSILEPDTQAVVPESQPLPVGSVHFGAVHARSESTVDLVEVEPSPATESSTPGEEASPVSPEPIAELESQAGEEASPAIDLRLEGEKYLSMEHGWVSSTDWSDCEGSETLQQLEEEDSPVAQAAEPTPAAALDDAGGHADPEVGPGEGEPHKEPQETVTAHPDLEATADGAEPEAQPESVATTAELAAEPEAVLVPAPDPVEADESVTVVDGAFAEDAAAEVPEAAPEIEPELVITETMAEVFLRQGHRPLALAVYAQLLEREPENPRLLEAVARLRGELLETRDPEAKVPAGAVAEPEEPVGSFLARVLGPEMLRDEQESEPVARDPGPLGGRPTRAAEDPSLSLNTIFGEDTRRRSVMVAGVDGGAHETEPSFDEFFGAERVPAGAGGDEAELEQFNAWLRSLQR